MINNLVIPPALILLAGAAVLPFLSKKLRSSAFLVFTFGALLLAWKLPEGATLSVSLMDYSLILCKVDALSRIFGIIFTFITSLINCIRPTRRFEDAALKI